MAHASQREYCEMVRNRFPNSFAGKRVLDVGSLDVNGNNRVWFTNCEYLGLDIGPGSNVDVVSPGHLYQDQSFDTIISTECFEHDMYFPQTLRNIIKLLRPGGLFTFTCATTGRPEHGTLRTDKGSSPLTTSLVGWNTYYRNVTESDVRQIIPVDKIFSEYAFDVEGTDLRFWGILAPKPKEWLPVVYYTPRDNFRDYEDPLHHPCYRLRIDQVHRRLLRDGHPVSIISTPELAEPCTLVITSIGADVMQLAERNREWGGYNIHDYTEPIYDIDILEQTRELCDFFACSSTKIAETLRSKYGFRAVVIKDPHEESNLENTTEWPEVPKAMFIHGGVRSPLGAMLAPVCEKAGYEFVEICNGGDIEWDLNWIDHMAKGQVALCPQDHWRMPNKSHIKAVTAMALGMPVLASPIQSYREIIENGKNGFICETLEDWQRGLEAFKNFKFYLGSREAAKKSVADYSPEKVYLNWKSILLNTIK